MPRFEFNAATVASLQRLADPREPLKLYREHRRGAFRRQIQLGVDPYQNRYRPLSRWYAIEKRAKYGQKPILEASGTMIRSYRGSILRNRFSESLNAPAGKHAKGDPSTRLPKRLPLADGRGLPASDRRALWQSVVIIARRPFR